MIPSVLLASSLYGLTIQWRKKLYRNLVLFTSIIAQAVHPLNQGFGVLFIETKAAISIVSPYVFLIMLAVSPLYGTVYYKFRKPIYELSYEYKEQENNIISIRTIKTIHKKEEFNEDELSFI